MYLNGTAKIQAAPPTDVYIISSTAKACQGTIAHDRERLWPGYAFLLSEGGSSSPNPLSEALSDCPLLLSSRISSISSSSPISPLSSNGVVSRCNKGAMSLWK